MTLRSMTREEVRRIDAQAAEDLGLPTLLLMENAGRGAALVLRNLAGRSPKRVTILCGPGNNGGDGAVLARHLDAWAWPVQVVWFAPADRLAGDPAVQQRILQAAGIQQIHLQDTKGLDPLLAKADWLVDGLLGTGLTRPVEGLLRSVIEAIQRSGKPVLALDLPSGLDANTGTPLGLAVQATATATFVARKAGFDKPGATAWIGSVHVVEIGVPGCLLKPFRQQS